jgi:hypothetical protein
LWLEMIYDEVVRFRHLVRNQQPPAPVEIPVQGGLQRSNSISQNTGGLPGAGEAQKEAAGFERPPRPQEAEMYEIGGEDEMGEVERELATGLDGR